jgi:hypothetical protein
MNDLYISIDMEANGPIPGDYSMVSVGAVVVEDVVPELRRHFYQLIKPLPGAKVIPAALAISGFSMEELETAGALPAISMQEFARWLEKVQQESRIGARVLPKQPKLVFASYGTFDWMFVTWYFHRFLGYNPFGPNGLDIKSLIVGFSHVDFSQTKKSNLPPWMRGKERHTHNALDDAIEQGQQLLRIFQRMEQHESVLRP